MRFFNKKKVLKAIASGNLIPLEQVSDEVFSSKMMGHGFAIDSHNGEVYAPIDGTIENIFPTKHAITLSDNKGISILIHMGIDTVDLQGHGFDILVSKNQMVRQGDPIAKIDNALLIENNKDNTIIVIVMENKTGKLLLDQQAVTPKDNVFKL